MSKAKMVTDAKNNETKEMTREEQAIDELVSERELRADWFDEFNDMNIPITIRLNKVHMSKLDHLAKRWRTNRSNLAGELLEEMINLVFIRVYKEKTVEELNQIITEILREFEKKRKVVKRKKE